jgi:hypothetical protein
MERAVAWMLQTQSYCRDLPDFHNCFPICMPFPISPLPLRQSKAFQYFFLIIFTSYSCFPMEGEGSTKTLTQPFHYSTLLMGELFIFSWKSCSLFLMGVYIKQGPQFHNHKLSSGFRYIWADGLGGLCLQIIAELFNTDVSISYVGFII